MAAIDIWKGVGLATLIYIAGIVAIPAEYFEAAQVDGASAWTVFRHIILPLSLPGHRDGHHAVADRWSALVRPDLGDDAGGPGFASDVVASVIYKQYQAGFYGLSTAGNVILFIVVTPIILPLVSMAEPKEVEL